MVFLQTFFQAIVAAFNVLFNDLLALLMAGSLGFGG